jgi:hypothetical protein
VLLAGFIAVVDSLYTKLHMQDGNMWSGFIVQLNSAQYFYTASWSATELPIWSFGKQRLPCWKFCPTLVNHGTCFDAFVTTTLTQ